jgi:hypothetical protein
MAISQNVRFYCEAQTETDVEHPPGAAIAKVLRRGLMDKGWRVSELDNWRDCGWVFVSGRNDAELQVVFAQMAMRWHWLLQLSPNYLSGFLGRLFGKKPSASPVDVYAAARDLHEIISRLACSQIYWCWDDIPNENNSNQEPTEPS